MHKTPPSWALFNYYLHNKGHILTTPQKGLMHNIGVQIVIAMVIGTLVGAIMGQSAAMFAPLGTIFIHLIKMLVIPLVAISIIAGAAALETAPQQGKSA